MQQTSIILKSRPKGWVTEDNFASTQGELRALSDGEILLKTHSLSVDPYMRGRMNDMKSYLPPFAIDAPIQSGLLARVIESKNDKFAEGSLVMGLGPWSDVFISDGTGFMTVMEGPVPLTYYHGILGMPGNTAYQGLMHIAELKEGENVYVSAASGAVGQVVGQIAKNMGCHVSGSAGDDDKVAYLLDDLGFDAAFNYKKEDNLTAALQKANPNGIDVYFENVGGPMLEAVFNVMNQKGRIPVCGMIADYNAASASEVSTAPKNMTMIIGKCLRIEGFLVDLAPEKTMEWVQLCSQWLMEGKIKYREITGTGA